MPRLLVPPGMIRARRVSNKSIFRRFLGSLVCNSAQLYFGVYLYGIHLHSVGGCNISPSLYLVSQVSTVV